MHFTVIREHREFFRKNHWLECDALLSSLELSRANEAIETILKQRGGSDFEKCYDLWRDSSFLKKIVLSKALSEIASELLEQKPLRLGYNTFFPSLSITSDQNYRSFLHKRPTLEEMSGIQGVLCGAMLCLSGTLENLNADFSSPLFSKTPGNAVFFSADWPLPLDELAQMPGFNYLLITYVKSNAVYIKQDGDPHLHLMKKLGYNFGDRLKEPFHPIVY